MLNNSQAIIIGFKSVRYATAARQPTLTIMAKVIVRTRTIDLKVLLGGADAVGKGICADEDGSINFSMEPLLFH